MLSFWSPCGEVLGNLFQHGVDNVGGTVKLVAYFPGILYGGQVRVLCEVLLEDIAELKCKYTCVVRGTWYEGVQEVECILA